jgi:2-phosphoglycerate kinase
MESTSVAWQVLLLGGVSGVGKSTIARELGLRLGIPWLEVDDLRLALTRAGVYFPDPDIAPGIAGVELLLDVARLLMPALEAVIENHIDQRQPIVIEGDGIHPAIATRPTLRVRVASGHVRIVFLVDDGRQLLANMRSRQRGIGVGPSDTLDAHVQKNVMYGERLTTTARQLQLPVVTARLWSDVIERVRIAAGSE